MGTWDRVADLGLRIDEEYALEPLRMNVSSGFERLSTVIRLRGDGAEGIGEDVTYDGEDQEAAWAAGPALPLAGEHTIGSFADHVAGLDLFPTKEPSFAVYRAYRRWGYESAALDLALNQAGISLHAALGREPKPLTFVVSLRLGEPATLEPVTRRLDRYPSLRFKLDATPDWSDDLIADLVATGSVDSIDFKGMYEGTRVDAGADPDLYRRVIDAFPGAWLEDPRLTPEIDELLRAHRDRVTWDAPIHAIADVEALPFPPRMVNVKPSRFGSLKGLLDTYDWLDERGIGAYGGDSSSSDRAAGRSSCWPASSIRRRRTTCRPPASTSPIRRPGFRPARSSPGRHRPACAGFSSASSSTPTSGSPMTATRCSGR